MLSLERTLLDYDFALLRMIAETTAVELTARNARSAASELADAISQQEQMELVLADLSQEGLLALEDIKTNNGRLPAAKFTRQFGDVRPLGPGAREREQPHVAPLNVAELLWYRGLLGRRFVNEESGPQEVFYIPADLLPFLPTTAPVETQKPLRERPGQKIEPPPRDTIKRGSSALVDDACTLLAYLRIVNADQKDAPTYSQASDVLKPYLQVPEASALLWRLLIELGFITKDRRVNARILPRFLHNKRGRQLKLLTETWRGSTQIKDVLHVPTLEFETAVAHQLAEDRARQAILMHLNDIPGREWTNLETFIAHVRKLTPDFQRPNGDYKSWYVKSKKTGRYLRGYEHWRDVDGAYIAYLICGPLHWLGMTDYATRSATDDAPMAFRLTQMYGALAGRVNWFIAERQHALQLNDAGEVLASRATNREIRYQLARITEWLPTQTTGVYRYRLSVKGIKRAARQQIQANQILGFLEKHAREELPDYVRNALVRWETVGPTGQIKLRPVLRVADAQILDALRANPNTRLYLGETLGELAIEVQPDYVEALQQAAFQLGFFLDIENEAG